jgi:nucleoside 2-deoxyribosyltransferase
MKMVEEAMDNGETDEVSRSHGFLDVFVVRSFRESHMEEVMGSIKEFISQYESPHWGGKPYHLVDSNREIGSGGFIQEEIADKIKRAMITIVILDGLRHNVLFELGFLYGSKKPFILLKHRRWGPSFPELDSAVSDLKGVMVKEFDHQKSDELRLMLEEEFHRCENEFFSSLGTHGVLPVGEDNLVTQSWSFQENSWKEIRDTDRASIKLASSRAVDLPLCRYVSMSSLLIVEFDLSGSDSGLTVYLLVSFRKEQEEKLVWFGYSTRSVGPHLYRKIAVDKEPPVEITIPADASGLGCYLLVDNIYQMVAQRLGGEPGRIVVKRVRLRGRSDSTTTVKRVLVTS